MTTKLIEHLADAPADTSEHSINEHNMDTFKSKWAKLVKRANKLGLDAPEYTCIRREERTWCDDKDQLHTARIMVVAVRARPVVLSGWSFVATIQHTDAGNVIRTVPTWEKPMPKEYRTASRGWCDHCRTERRRNETFVVINGDGEMKRVGRTCLADFVATERDGINVVHAANWTVSFSCFMDDMERMPGGGEIVHNAVDFVAQTIRCIRVDGWLSRGKARDEGGYATADNALSTLNDRRLPAPQPGPEYDVQPADVDEAKVALEWAQEIDEDTTSDYLHNLRIGCSFTYVTHKEAGIVASVVQAYRRHVEEVEADMREASLPPKGTRYVGKAGDKFGRKLSKKDKTKGVESHPAVLAVVASVRWFSNDWGCTAKVVFERNTGECRDVFAWWASNPQVQDGDERRDLERGDTVELAGTVKKHSEYNGVKETVLTRCATTLCEG